MMLRVWAMYNRSRLILGTLLTLFVMEIASAILALVINSVPKNLSVATIQILDFSVCVVEYTSPTWTEVATILQISHGTAMCMLALFQFMRQSFQMYCVTKQWQPNRYMTLLVSEGFLYFLVVFVLSLMNVLSVSGKLRSDEWQWMLLFFLGYVPLYTLVPRFIVSIREMYARDVQGRCGGGIDTGFGLLSYDRDAGGTTIV